jgi:hypothetical protein
VRFGLASEHEYQIGFLRPLFSDEGMREEQRLGASFRRLAGRSSPAGADSPARQRAA